MNKLDLDYQNLLKDILENGTTKETRNGGTLSVFGRQIRHRMSDGFPLITTKKMPFRLIATELIWFLRGDTSIEYLLKNNCNIWTGDALKAYHKHEMDEFKKLKEKYPNRRYKFALTTKEEFINKIKTDTDFAKQWSSLGKIYGHQWRNWNDGIDQISDLIKQLKENPDSRRLLVSAWNPSDLPHQVLPPCHYGFQVYTRELSRGERWDLLRKQCWGKSTIPWDRMAFPSHEWMDEVTTIDAYDNNHNLHKGITISIPRRAISLMFNMRSTDVPLGLPFNIASYGLLLEIIAKEVNMVPDELIGNLGDAHIYLNQIEGIKEQLTRDPYPLPNLIINDEFWNPDTDLVSNIPHIEISDFYLENYNSHPSIKMPLSN